MTSRAEYRLVLRQDNADLRLTEKSYLAGLASEERYRRFLRTKEAAEKELERLERAYVTPGEINGFLERNGSTPLQNRISLAELLKRPEMNYHLLEEIDPVRPELSQHSVTQLEVRIKYQGYITKQLQQIERFKKLENKKLYENFNYDEVDGLRIEARQKLNQLQPVSVGQASRISGVSPADINVLLIHLEKKRRRPAN
jgi:tRNA uridine 5-carboxymethylaminomethyl modification enzyme